jgi:hypothetical protein
LRPLVISNEVEQPAALTLSGSEPVAVDLTIAVSKQAVASPPLRASTEKQATKPKPLGVKYARMLAERKQVSRRADQPAMPAHAISGSPLIRLSSSMPLNRGAVLSPWWRPDPMPVLEPGRPAGPRATPLALGTTSDDRGTIVERTRGLLAAIARWREADPGVAMDAFDAAPAKSAGARVAKQEDGRDQACAPVPAITPAVAAYRRRQRFAKSAGDSRTGPVHIIPDREWLEDHPRTEFDERAMRAIEQDGRLIDRLHKADVYVGDYKTGPLELDPRVIDALKVGGDWLLQAHVQRALRAIRMEQQQVVEALRAEAQARPLAFSRTGLRFWPNDLAPQLKQRLDRWSRDECFGNDMTGIETTVRQAHCDNDAEQNRGKASASPRTEVEQHPAEARRRVQQQHGEYLDGIRILAFGKKTEKPTSSLLMLIRYAGEHPDRIDLDSTGPRAGEGVPETIRSLLKRWRGDARVRQLVEGTVNMTRAAGRPTWPSELSYEMRAIVRDAPSPSPSMHEPRLSR